MITLPYTENLKNVFGVSKNNTKTVLVQGRASVFYDLLNRLALDSSLNNSELGERQLVLKHSEYWTKNDLIIYDRGYVGYDFQYEHFKKNVDYLIRTSLTHSRLIKEFVESKKQSAIINIFPNQKHALVDKEYTKYTSLKVRLIRIVLSTGEIKVLMTSLLDSQIFPASMFKELYFLRWEIETFYDELKNKLKLEYFTGYSKVSIDQDFFCTIFICNLRSTIVNDLQDELKLKNKNTKLNYKINTNLSYGLKKNRILELLFKETPLEEVFKELENLFLKTQFQFD